MKKSILFLLILLLLGSMACVKQKNCDCELTRTGKFVYYEKPQEIIYCGDLHKKVDAVLILDERDYYIVGSIPNKFQTQDTVFVTACLKEVPKNDCLTFGIGVIYKLTCIEKED